MLATSERVRPWSALWRASSLGRPTVIVVPSIEMAMSGWKVRCSSPLGPFAETVDPFTETVMPAGTVTGFLPIRDIVAPLPDEGDELATELGRPRVAVGHQALGGRDDRHAEAVLDPRDLPRLHVAPETGLRDALELTDHRQLVVILQVQPEDANATVVQDLVLLDVVVVLEEPGHFGLQLAHRHVDAPVVRLAGVPDARQHVCHRIGHAHECVILTSWPYERRGPRP